MPLLRSTLPATAPASAVSELESLGVLAHTPNNAHMNLKTATLVAIIGQILALIYWQCYSFFHLYRVFSEGVQPVLNLVVAVIGQGSLVLFLIALYSKQK